MTAPTITPLHEAIAAGIQQRGVTTFRPTWLTATIEVYTPEQSSEQEATIHYEGDLLTGSRDDRWGWIERESREVETTWAEDADSLLDTLAGLVDEHWEITLIEMPEHIARELVATLEDVPVIPWQAKAPAMEIIVRVTGTFTPAPRNYIGKHRKA